MVVTINFFNLDLLNPDEVKSIPRKFYGPRDPTKIYKDGVLFPRVTSESKSAHVEIHADPCLLGLFGFVRRTKNRKKLTGCW